LRGFSFLNITGRGVGTVNEPAIRTEEQIISLFPDRETQVCRAYLYRHYQKNQEEKSSGKEE
jgi:peroxiredoxin